MAENAPDTNIFFVPGFNGLQAPINDPSATAGFIGMVIYYGVLTTLRVRGTKDFKQQILVFFFFIFNFYNNVGHPYMVYIQKIFFGKK